MNKIDNLIRLILLRRCIICEILLLTKFMAKKLMLHNLLVVGPFIIQLYYCLLYTSDAADE